MIVRVVDDALRTAQDDFGISIAWRFVKTGENEGDRVGDVRSDIIMANRSYLCSTNLDTIYPAFVDERYDSDRQTIANDVSANLKPGEELTFKLPMSDKTTAVPGLQLNSHRDVLVELSSLRAGKQLPSVRIYLDDLPYSEDEQWNFTRVLGAGRYGSGMGRKAPWEKRGADYGFGSKRKRWWQFWK